MPTSKKPVEPSSEAVELDAGAEGVKARVPMRFFEFIAPGRAAKVLINKEMAKTIAQKLADNQPLNSGEQFFFINFYGKELAHFQRQLETADLMQRLALQEPESFPPPSDAEASHPGESNFVERFWEDAKCVTDEDMRELYARVGLWEDRVPGSFSLRTLSVLRDLDRGTKEKFEKLCRTFVLMGDMVVEYEYAKPVYEGQGIGWGDLMILEDARLLHLAGSTTRVVAINPGEAEDLEFGPFTLRLSIADPKIQQQAELRLPCFLLTQAGRELASLAPPQEVNEEYVWIVSALLQNQHPFNFTQPLGGMAWRLDVQWARGDETDFSPVDDEFGARFSEALAERLKRQKQKQAKATAKPPVEGSAG